MRDADKSRNYSYLRGLIEEAQNMGTKMEAAFEVKKGHEYWYKKGKELEAEAKKLDKELEKRRAGHKDLKTPRTKVNAD
jgi:hypothetical protein